MSNQFSVSVHDEIRATAARSEVYKILSALFDYPHDDQVKQFVMHDAPNALRQAAPFLPYPVDAIDTLQPAGDGEDVDLAAAFTGLFDNCGGRSLLSLHEKDFSSDDTQQLWEDLIRIYEYFGVKYHLGNNKEWPDWIGMEFEFLHLLTFLEASVDSGRALGYIAAEADFLERHPGRWIPKFCAALAKKAAGTPYAAYADVLEQFIGAELDFNRERRPARQIACNNDMPSTKIQH